MPKLHMRLSVELEITDEQLIKIVEDAKAPTYEHLYEVEYDELPLTVQAMINAGNFTACDWDEGGYIPSSWLVYDAVDSGLYEADENGVRRKENA